MRETENCVTAIFCEARDKNHPNTHYREHGIGETSNHVTAVFCETKDEIIQRHTTGSTAWRKFNIT